jgi:lipopolysaccharide export system protein LptA
MSPIFHILLSCTLLLCSGTGASAAIPESLLNLGKGDDLELQADEGIEWRQKEHRYIARGNVLLRKDGMTLKAATVGADYDTVADKTQVRTLFAEGGFVAATATEQLTGGKAVYDLQKGTLHLTGGPIVLKTREQTARADDSFSYDVNARRAVVRGNATLIQDGNTLKADTIILLLVPERAGSNKLVIKRADATGHVHITTPQESLTGNSGFYDAIAGIVKINDKVVLRRGGHSLAGSEAQVNLKTGISTLENTGNGGRVHGVLRVDELESPKKQ